jgi:hypothetical protein
MAENDGPGTTPSETKGSLGFQDLSMNELPSAQPVAAGDAPGHSGRIAALVIAVLAVVAFLVIGSRLLSNAAPGQEAEMRLRQRLGTLPIWKKGVVMEVHYVAGDRIRLDFSSRLSTTVEEQQALIRDATRQALLVLREERPGRDLYVDGYQGEEQILSGEYRQKSTLIGAGGEHVPDIAIRIAGEGGGGLGGAFSETSGTRR